MTPEVLPVIDRKSDEYKYTDLGDFSFQKFSSEFASKLVALRDSGDKYPGTKVIRLSSSSAEIEFSGDFEQDGVTVMPWSEVQAKDPAFFAKISALPAKLQNDIFARWTGEHASHGIVVRVAKGQRINETIQIIHRLDSSMMNHRVCVWVEEGAQCSILEEYRTVKADFGTNSVPTQVASLVSVHAAPATKVSWVQIQSLPDSVVAIMRAQVDAERDAEVTGAVVSLGAGTAHYHLEFCSLGSGSHLDFVCAGLGTRQHHNDFYIKNSHPAKDSTSETRILNVVADEATAVFNGMIEIPLHAPRVDAAHRAKSLVLSPKARVQSNPKLEIATDDVKCAHGSSISSIDPSQLYYLQSRGISRPDAESMIVDSFLNPALDRIPVEGVKSHYKGLVSRLRHNLAGAKV